MNQDRRGGASASAPVFVWLGGVMRGNANRTSANDLITDLSTPFVTPDSIRGPAFFSDLAQEEPGLRIKSGATRFVIL